MEQTKSKFHLLIMLGICAYLISSSGLLIYGLINTVSRPYVIAFIVLVLLISAYAAATAKTCPTKEKQQEKDE